MHPKELLCIGASQPAIPIPLHGVVYIPLGIPPWIPLSNRPPDRGDFDVLRCPHYMLTQNGWRILASRTIFNHILDIHLGLKNLMHLYQLCSQGQYFYFHVHSPHRYLFTTIDPNDETGWKSDIPKLRYASRDKDDFPPGFDDKHIYRCEEMMNYFLH